ncbi:Crp/Fnr family transcriptional regulator [Chryseobacterium caseinilyticum]|uniref:Crp/Fnr family transcriptional regulator n=1 Tax=Chryseobacterium caseinilyticum TaxID=2771428 RepID=A0ABR8Z7V5_9FLAO|nr:Crp/Fnr family transcriptional regulator [Chryseobacterium caseinilyticum]MBD8081364.1 Crp/Fnr family transcriptional regulator [Chryseobacterium caseinilyticum]
MISEDLLLSFGAEYKSYDHDDRIFSENEVANYFYHITEGKVKLNNYIENGKEFIHGIVAENSNIGTSYLFTEKKYSINSIAINDVTVLRLPKVSFLELLNTNQNIYPFLMSHLSEYMHYQFVMMQTIAVQSPEKKIKAFLDYLKNNEKDQSEFSLQIQLTRQQLASITGLSVETVIRAIKIMEKNGVLEIQNRKIFY